MAELDPESVSTGVLSERIKNLQESIIRLEHRLFGNGTPGEIGELKERTTSLEKLMWRINGVGIVLIAVIELLSKYWHK